MDPSSTSFYLDLVLINLNYEFPFWAYPNNIKAQKANWPKKGSLSQVPFYSIYKGSVWIWLILLKLKIYCWNHYSKIIFKCVNSIVGPIFNEKVAKKWNLWVHEQYIMHCLWQKSQLLRLLFIKQYMNSNRVLPKRGKKKKKTQNADGWYAVSKLTLYSISDSFH